MNIQKNKKVININCYLKKNKKEFSLKSASSSCNLKELGITQQTKDKPTEHIIIQLRKKIEHINHLIKRLRPITSPFSHTINQTTSDIKPSQLLP